MLAHPLFRLAVERRNAFEWLAVAAGAIASGVLVAYLALYERQVSFAADTERMRAQAQVIDLSLHRQLEAVRWALDGTRAALAADSGCGDACRHTLVQSLKRAMPGVRALLAVGPDGRILLSDDDLGDRQLDDRAFLASLPRLCSGTTLYLSDPYENQREVFNIKVALSMSTEDGCGHGAVLAILDPEYFDAVMRSALYAPDMSIALADAAGRTLLLVPPDPEELRKEAAGGAPASRGPGQVRDGIDRLVVRRSLQLGDLGTDRSLELSMTRRIGPAGAGARRLAWAAAVAWSLFWLVSVAGLLFAQRRRVCVLRLALDLEAERQAAAERVELALNGASLGLWDWHLPSGRRSLDGRACAILGYAEGEREVVHDSPFDLVHPDDRGTLEQTLENHLAGRTPAFDAEFRMRHRGGHWVWIQSRGKVVERTPDGAPVRMVGTRSDISARKQAEAEIAHLAFYDGLTKLPNRRLLLDRLGQALAKSERTGAYGALLFVDLDNFKALNDSRGHDVGDRLLEMVAFRLQQVTRDTDTVARLGGDEFVLLLEGLGEEAAEASAHAELVARKVIGGLQPPYSLDGHEHSIAPSVGVTLFGKGNGLSHDLLRQADLAMYEAKAAGGATFRFFDPRMQAAVDAATTLEAELRFALARHEFELFYQPVVDQLGIMVGVEGLIRWRHPRKGLTAPGAFIPQAEKSDLIVGIGDWVLQEACRQLARWARDPATAEISIAVNVSARQFRQEKFVPRLLALLEASGVRPQRLKLELTESLLLSDVEDTIARMQALRRHGIGFSLDDFGTGYSSLSYLQMLPLDQLKIDQSFVREMLRAPHATSIVQAIVHLASSLGLQVVAEGVETEAQWDSLRRIGCTSFQGYLFATPMSAAALVALRDSEPEGR
jgi:diguanylate cyclase (GGDEF)-like protein/PAS domain S-box-containing protein